MIYSLMALVFVIGYIAIALEHNIHVDKAASALLTAILVWTLLVFGADTLLVEQLASPESLGVSQFLNSELRHHLAEIAEILFFLMGAMVIVELIDAHDGFYAITSRIKTTSAVTLLWTIGILTFFFSALLDNLTTTIVMVSLLRKLVADKEMRWWYVGMVVICANAGGAWSPIGDVTTTMLWIGNQVTASKIIVDLIVPSLIAAAVPLAVLSFFFKGKEVFRPKDPKPVPQASSSNYLGPIADDDNTVNAQAMYMESVPTTSPESLPKGQIAAIAKSSITNQMRISVLVLGLSALAFVPIFKTVTHLPPYMGILFGLGVLWVYTEIMHRHHDWYVKEHMTVVGVLTRVDIPSILFF